TAEVLDRRSHLFSSYEAGQRSGAGSVPAVEAYGKRYQSDVSQGRLAGEGDTRERAGRPVARSQSVRQTPLQWEIVALVKALNVVAIETFVTDLHPGAHRARGRKFLDGEPDRLRCRRKAAILQRLSGSALALSSALLKASALSLNRSAARCWQLQQTGQIERTPM